MITLVLLSGFRKIAHVMLVNTFDSSSEARREHYHRSHNSLINIHLDASCKTTRRFFCLTCTAMIVTNNVFYSTNERHIVVFRSMTCRCEERALRNAPIKNKLPSDSYTCFDCLHKRETHSVFFFLCSL